MPTRPTEDHPEPEANILSALPHLDYTFEEDADEVANAAELDATDIGDEERGSTPYSHEDRLRQSMFSTPAQTRATTEVVLKLLYRPAFAVVILNMALQSSASHEISQLQFMSILVFVVLPLLGINVRKKSGTEHDANKKS